LWARALPVVSAAALVASLTPVLTGLAAAI
jgi:hypothetical protein